MNVDLAQLRALAAVVAEGSFDAAASALHVTPSAVSQRIKALEQAAGRVLVQRARPVEVTTSGEAYLRLARQVDALVHETRSQVEADGPLVTVPLAVNADSMATWVLPALAPLADQIAFDLHREDQAHTTDLLRAGAVMAAVTSAATPVQGCRSTRLGTMTYRPVCTAAFSRRWFTDGVDVDTLAEAPVVVFDRKDDLQDAYLRRHDAPLPPRHHVPASADFLDAVRLGLGWGMLPDLQSAPLVRSGELVVLDDDGHEDVPLYWQQWRLETPALARVAAAVRAAAATALEPA